MRLLRPRVKLKPLDRQVMVITGASSGIGLVTARRAADAGAKLVLVARNEQTLSEIAEEINARRPGQAIAVAADTADLDAVRHVAEAARGAFSSFDTWVNAAAVSIYGSLREIPFEEHRRLFETNYWGYVYSSLVALDELAEHGGALINVGSVLSDRAIPEQGPYCASKHAIKGFTDALRVELEERRVPVSVTLIKPSAIDTPYKEHARNYFDVRPKNPPPVYAPQTVARAILHAAVHPRREIYVGAGGRLVSAIGRLMPGLTDRVMTDWMSWFQKTDEPVDPAMEGRHSLFEPMEDGAERGDYPHHVSSSSLYTQATLHPFVTTAVVVGAGVALGVAWRNAVRQHASEREPARAASERPVYAARRAMGSAAPRSAR